MIHKPLNASLLSPLGGSLAHTEHASWDCVTSALALLILTAASPEDTWVPAVPQLQACLGLAIQHVLTEAVLCVQCRLPGANGTWMVVEGGMGTVTQRLAEAARAAGATIHTSSPVESILTDGNMASGVRLSSGAEVKAKAVMVNADPFRCASTALPA